MQCFDSATIKLNEKLPVTTYQIHVTDYLYHHSESMKAMLEGLVVWKQI